MAHVHQVSTIIGRLTTSISLADALRDAVYVQECAFESLEVLLHVLSRIHWDEHLNENVLFCHNNERAHVASGEAVVVEGDRCVRNIDAHDTHEQHKCHTTVAVHRTPKTPVCA